MQHGQHGGVHPLQQPVRRGQGKIKLCLRRLLPRDHYTGQPFQETIDTALIQRRWRARVDDLDPVIRFQQRDDVPGPRSGRGGVNDDQNGPLVRQRLSPASLLGGSHSRR